MKTLKKLGHYYRQVNLLEGETSSLQLFVGKVNIFVANYGGPCDFSFEVQEYEQIEAPWWDRLDC